ncbi:hypothetical protein RI367_000885 [Sorochytrium milnesiophthora]
MPQFFDGTPFVNNPFNISVPVQVTPGTQAEIAWNRLWPSFNMANAIDVYLCPSAGFPSSCSALFSNVPNAAGSVVWQVPSKDDLVALYQKLGDQPSVPPPSVLPGQPPDSAPTSVPGAAAPANAFSVLVSPHGLQTHDFLQSMQVGRANLVVHSVTDTTALPPVQHGGLSTVAIALISAAILVLMIGAMAFAARRRNNQKKKLRAHRIVSAPSPAASTDNLVATRDAAKGSRLPHIPLDAVPAVAAGAAIALGSEPTSDATLAAEPRSPRGHSQVIEQIEDVNNYRHLQRSASVSTSVLQDRSHSIDVSDSSSIMADISDTPLFHTPLSPTLPTVEELETGARADPISSPPMSHFRTLPATVALSATTAAALASLPSRCSLAPPPGDQDISDATMPPLAMSPLSKLFPPGELSASRSAVPLLPAPAHLDIGTASSSPDRLSLGTPSPPVPGPIDSPISFISQESMVSEMVHIQRNSPGTPRSSPSDSTVHIVSLV